MSFFQKHKRPLHRFEDSEGEDRFGFTMTAIDLSWLKKMLMKGFVEKLEIRILDIASSSEILSGAVRIIFFAMFRRRIGLSALEQIYRSPLLRSWNRANPRRAIGPEERIPRHILKAALEPLADRVGAIREDLRNRVAAGTMYVKRTWDDEQKLAFFIDETVAELDPLVFFVLAGSAAEERAALLGTLAAQIASFAGMVDLLDMAGLLSIELAGAAERSALFRVMTRRRERHFSPAAEDLKALVRKSAFRGSTIVVSIPRRVSREGRLKFRFSFYNDGADVNMERALMEDFTERSGRYGPEKNLEDFFQERGNGGSGVRVYYLDILRRLCERHRVKLRSGISAGGNASVTNLSFGF